MAIRFTKSVWGVGEATLQLNGFSVKTSISIQLILNVKIKTWPNCFFLFFFFFFFLLFFVLHAHAKIMVRNISQSLERYCI